MFAGNHDHLRGRGLAISYEVPPPRRTRWESAGSTMYRRLPLYPFEQTSPPTVRMSQKCHDRMRLWWVKIQLACSVSACSDVTVAGLQNHLRTRQLGEGD